MFTFFKKPSIEDKLRSKYDRLMIERDQLLRIDKSQSNLKYNEAQRILNQLESLRNAI
ncbi:Lacal_2735 family protein [Tenacibaculum sp. MEBiC06402]|uniref:Lacal_2735 family protein n=1 Tax=unclassified Tenacibaculum TaxID=2635139 RepID=UPI003B9CF819